MNKPQFYDEAPNLSGDFVPLVPGGYICEIKKAVEQKAQKTGNPMLVLLLDIAEGDKKGYFQERFEKDTRQEKKMGLCIKNCNGRPKKIRRRKKTNGRKIKRCYN